MEDYIYILIGVIWVAAGIYKASKKKKQQSLQSGKAIPATDQAEMPKAKSFLEQLLADQGMRIPEPEEYPEDVYEGVEEVEEKRRFQNEYSKFGLSELEQLSEEGVSSINRITFTDHMKQTNSRRRKHIKIDLRKAIIYEAILERPYP